MKEWTHADLVARAARWLWGTYGCKAVLTEMTTHSGEIPDVIGWKFNGRSVLVECKTSRADFKADADKPFRQNLNIALGAERYYFVPAGLIKPEELPADWGLAELKGNGVHITVHARPRKDLRSDVARNYEMRMLVAALGRTAARLQPIQLNDWLRWENREQSLNQMHGWVTKEDHEAHLSALAGWEQVTDPKDLPIDDVTGEAWCPKHEQAFADCCCIGPGEQHVQYEVKNGVLMAFPMAMHCCKFEPIELRVAPSLRIDACVLPTDQERWRGRKDTESFIPGPSLVGLSLQGIIAE